MELPEDVVLAVAVGLDRHKNQYGNRERKEVKQLSRNLGPERKGGSGGNGDSTDDKYPYSTGRVAGQVHLAVFQFEGPARAWWNMIRAKWEREGTAWTWLNFMQEFNEKYLPPIVQEKREDEFIKLRQGTLSVSEYET
ncbi:uncharacterized protein LOC113757259 [Coffea eugenioides]|uniref:uncharacterized protein LOC113755073 n=1 Tax=Coffea eugenioides TaxID=49369 RepID=UPI000F60F8EB|nr:uncharacterized protein LOC113755073 [Coffea eugenioides]XP_027156429.1 uncharacterized protein LOC113757259 [Coffea eugenioides]